MVDQILIGVGFQTLVARACPTSSTVCTGSLSQW